MDAKVDTLIFPCKHICMCGNCAALNSKDNICPICRVPIRDFTKVFVDWN
jgi:recombinational DNA repair protein RecR